MPPCPACEAQPLSEEKDESGVAFDLCPKCRGVWLDSGELSTLLGKPAAEGLLDFRQGARKCVRCAKPMLRGSFVSPGLLVDRCAPCGGLWLDHQELRLVRKLLGVDRELAAERAPAAPAPAQAAPPAQASLPVSDLPGTSLEASSLQSRPAATPAWLLHGLWWLVIGLAVFFWGWREVHRLEALRAAGGLVGPAPKHLLGFGAVMAALGLYFVLAQPEDAADGYLAVFRSGVSHAFRRRYGRHCRHHHWYDA